MQVPLEITFRGMPNSPSAEAAIRRWVARLEHIYERIQHCSVVIEQPHRNQRQGNQFHIRIDLSIPNHDIAVARDSGNDRAHEDIYIAIADAFRAARRRLQNVSQIQRGEVKLHAS
jgi:ribosome-associated translation inhibitor RaiA